MRPCRTLGREVKPRLRGSRGKARSWLSPSWSESLTRSMLATATWASTTSRRLSRVYEISASPCWSLFRCRGASPLYVVAFRRFVNRSAPFVVPPRVRSLARDYPPARGHVLSRFPWIALVPACWRRVLGGDEAGPPLPFRPPFWTIPAPAGPAGSRAAAGCF